MYSLRTRRRRRWLRRMLWSLTLAAVLVAPRSSEAADPRFLGNLALLDEEPVAQQLELSTEQRNQVRSLVKRREAAALELAIAARQLSPAERRQQLAEFVNRSEEMARQLLKPTQQQMLVQCQLSRDGLEALARENSPINCHWMRHNSNNFSACWTNGRVSWQMRTSRNRRSCERSLNVDSNRY